VSVLTTPKEYFDSVRPARVAAVAAFGFTERQARFLVTVMVHSGVFLERQYCAFADISHGQKTHDFVAKLIARRFATSIAPGRLHQGRLYHVHYKPLYEAIGEPDNRLSLAKIESCKKPLRSASCPQTEPYLPSLVLMNVQPHQFLEEGRARVSPRLTARIPSMLPFGRGHANVKNPEEIWFWRRTGSVPTSTRRLARPASRT
jgi:hypothetical protein